MPHPRDRQSEQMPRGCPGGGWAPLELIDALKLDIYSIFLSRDLQISAKLNTDETILMPGTDYFGDNIPFNTTRKSLNHTLSRTDENIHNHALSSHVQQKRNVIE